ncbi:hypothetical protein Pdca_34270 [Pseudonocardia autotrophica]|nr:hypothetical protein Pdca_34270 [Pseudonocardia autotrophica]
MHTAEVCAPSAVAPACPAERHAPSGPAVHDVAERAASPPASATARVRVLQPSPVHCAVSSALSCAVAPPVATSQGPWSPQVAVAIPWASPSRGVTVPARRSGAMVAGSSVLSVVLSPRTGQSSSPERQAPDAPAVVAPVAPVPVPDRVSDPSVPTTARQPCARPSQLVADSARPTLADRPATRGTSIAATASWAVLARSAAAAACPAAVSARPAATAAARSAATARSSVAAAARCTAASSAARPSRTPPDLSAAARAVSASVRAVPAVRSAARAAAAAARAVSSAVRAASSAVRAAVSAAAWSRPARAAAIAASASPSTTVAETVSDDAAPRHEPSGQSRAAVAFVAPLRVPLIVGSVTAEAPACTAHPAAPDVQLERERESETASPAGVAERAWPVTVAVQPGPAHSPEAWESLVAAGAFSTVERAAFCAVVAAFSAVVAFFSAAVAFFSASTRSVLAARRCSAEANGLLATRSARAAAASAAPRSRPASSVAVSAVLRAVSAASRRCRTITSATTWPLPAMEELVPRHPVPALEQVLVEELASAGGPRAPWAPTSRPVSSVPEAELRTVPRQEPSPPAQSSTAEALVHAEAPDTLGAAFAPAPGDPVGSVAGGWSP